MNWKNTSKLFFVGLLSVGLATAVACGDDENGTSESQEPNGNGNGTPSYDLTCDEGDNPPPRCSESTDGFGFGPATHVNKLEIADTDCCVDFTDGGDGDPDNGLAILLETAENLADISREDLNADIAESIAEGSINIVFEHDGLEEFDDGQEFTLNFLLGEEVSGGEATIDPLSFEEGAHPHAFIPNAELDGSGGLTAGPGTMILSLDIGAISGGALELDLDLTIRQAQLVANASVDNGVEDGVNLSGGELGGLLMIADIIDALNDFAADCDCLENPDPMITMDDGDIMSIACIDEIENKDFEDEPEEDFEEVCEATDEELCGLLADNCSFVSFLGIAADIDSNDDGVVDAASIGLLIEGESVVITGVGN